MEVWTIVSALWLSSWIMCIVRTYPIIFRMVENTEGGELIVSYKYTHMMIYAICLFIITPLIWSIIYNDSNRQRWCIAYVVQICRSKK